MSIPVVNLDIRESKVTVKPASYLGGRDTFQRYVEACRAHGAIYNKAADAQLCPIDSVPELLAALRESGFSPYVSDALAAALRIRAQEARADIKAAGDRVAAVKEGLAALGLALYPFQEIGVRWLAPRRSSILGDNMGLGKTIQALIAHPEGKPYLVAAPVNAKPVWAKFAALWRPDLKVTVLKGNGSFRWPEPGELVITGHEILPKVGKTDAKKERLEAIGEPLPGTTLDVDEAHRFKNPKALKTERLRVMLKAVWKAEGRSTCITGTPLKNKLQDLLSLLQTFDILKEAYGSYSRFLALWNGSQGYWGGYEWGTPTPAAGQCLKKVMIRRLRGDTELPPCTWERYPVAVDAKMRAACEALEKTLKEAGITLEELLEGMKNLSGAAFAEASKVRKLLAAAKIPALLELVEDAEESDEPLVVYTAHRAPADILGKREGWACIMGGIDSAKRGVIEADFQAGKYKGLVLTIGAGSEALTLTRSHELIFLDMGWVWSDNHQAVKRIHRDSQKSACRIRILHADGTLDTQVAEINEHKAKLEEDGINKAAIGINDKIVGIDPDALEAAAVSSAAPPPPPPPPSPWRGPETVQEKWASASLLTLAELDPDRAATTNGVGFNKLDGGFGHSLASQMQRRGLSSKQWAAAIRLCRKYHNQIGECPDGTNNSRRCD